MESTSATLEDCPVHGRGARIARWLTPPRQGTGKGVRTWTCPECTRALQAVPVVPLVELVSGMEGLQSLVAAAKQAGVIVYDDPRTLDYDTLEEGVRVPCRRINESGWCFTAESCHGHVHEDHRWGGTWGDDPFLRLTSRREHFGHLLYLMARACEYDEPEPTPMKDGGVWVNKRVLGFTVHRDDRGEPEFMSVIIRVAAPRVYTRNLVLQAFERFAELVNQELPRP